MLARIQVRRGRRGISLVRAMNEAATAGQLQLLGADKAAVGLTESAITGDVGITLGAKWLACGCGYAVHFA